MFCVARPCRPRYNVYILFLAEVLLKLFTMAVVKAGCGALNTQTFFLPGGATSSWWEGLVPQSLGEAKSTEKANVIDGFCPGLACRGQM